MLPDTDDNRVEHCMWWYVGILFRHRHWPPLRYGRRSQGAGAVAHGPATFCPKFGLKSLLFLQAQNLRRQTILHVE